jgi:hypothetical protein
MKKILGFPLHHLKFKKKKLIQIDFNKKNKNDMKNDIGHPIIKSNLIQLKNDTN